MIVPPRFHTARNPDRRTRGREVAKIAAAQGRPFMPWQRIAADVTSELDEFGRYWYDTVVIRVQRQAGKTQMVGDTATHRGLRTRAGRLWYTSQSGRLAGEWFRDEYLERLEAADVFTGRYRSSLRAGGESVCWHHSRAKFQAFPPVRKAMHSKQSDLTIVDEAWAFDAEAGAELRQAIRPTMSTRPGSQLWIVSAAGDDNSAYLSEYVELGRLSLTDPDSRVAYIEYGIPEDADPEDLDTIAAYHPAIGHTIDMAHLVAARADFGADSAGFARAYGTRDTSARVAAFPPGAWTECGRGRTDPDTDRIALAIDCTPDGRRLAVAAAWPTSTGVTVELLYAGPPTQTATDIVRAAAGRDLEVTFDPQSVGTIDVVDDVTAAGVTCKAITAAQMGAACAAITRHVLARTLTHHHQADLTAAADIAAKRPLLDGGFAWTRAKSGGSICELVAATLAVRAAGAPTPTRRKPVARSGTPAR